MNRQSLIKKVRALLSKTVENGCTEAEALAALDLARAMTDNYEISDAELALTKEEKAIFSNGVEKLDSHGIRYYLAVAVAEYTDCRVWRNQTGGLTFCGLRSDADFAEWLIESLANFATRELAGYLAGLPIPKGERRRHINGFVGGICGRISNRLRELVARSKAAPASVNTSALIVVKSAAVAEAMAGIRLGKSRKSTRRSSSSAYEAGRAAGDRASINRPIGGSGAARIG